MNKTNPLVFVALGCALLLSLWIGYAIRESIEVKHAPSPAYTPRIVVNPAIPQVKLPPTHYGRAEPEQVTVTPVAGEPGPPGAPGETRVVILRDTLRIAVPSAIAETPDDVRLTTDKPVTIRRPLFGSPTVSVSTYNPASNQYEDLRYRVAPNPVQYGAEVAAFVLPNVDGGLTPGIGARAYLGYRGVQPFVGADATPDGFQVRAGLRYRIGR